MTYHRFTSSMRLSDLVQANVSLLRVLARFELHPGFGDRTVEDACLARGIDPEFFVEIVNVFHDARYFPEMRLRRLDVRSIIEYLSKAHKDYAEHMLPAVGRLVDKLVASGGDRNRGIGMVGTMFDEYRKEFLDHIAREEELVFLHALRVADAFRQGTAVEGIEPGGLDAIREFMAQHSHMEETLNDLQTILISHIEQPFDVRLCTAVIMELARFEQDVLDHGRIEDRILFAAVAHMEARLQESGR